MSRALYPGTFDPVTNGHIDVMERAACTFDEIVVTVFRSGHKTPLFTVEERLFLLRETTRHIPNLRIDSFAGLVVDYAREQGVQVILRGLRAILDFDYEFQMALMNRRLAPGVETYFLLTSPRYSYLSSTLVKEVVANGGSVKGLVPALVEERLQEKFRRQG